MSMGLGNKSTGWCVFSGRGPVKPIILHDQRTRETINATILHHFNPPDFNVTHRYIAERFPFIYLFSSIFYSYLTFFCFDVFTLTHT